MAKPLLPNELWNRIEPLLPPPKPRRFRFPGRKPVDNRKALIGILFVLRTGIRWEDLPQELGCGSGMTCWRRLRDWHEAGIWQALHEHLLAELNGADRIDWSRAAVDSSSVRALGGGEKTGPNPTDRSKPGSKHHVITDGGGIPLATTLTGANAADVGQLIPLVDRIPPIRGKPGRPRRRPDRLYADRAYHSEPHSDQLRARGIDPQIARRRTPHGSGLGRYRWVVERTLSWFHRPRKLRLRTEWRNDIHEALMSLCCSLICWSVLTSSLS
jgi:transposase